MTATHHSRSVSDPFVLRQGDGAHYHFLNHLATVKISSSAGGLLSAVEFVAPHGFGPPMHRHEDEDEMFIVLEGDMLFLTGDDEIAAGPGSYAYLPLGKPHTFQVRSETARFASITAATTQHPRFDQMVGALGTPVDEPGLPDPAYIDPALVAEVCRVHGIELVGPPPPSLD